MSIEAKNFINPIRQVIVYMGHDTKPHFGPYRDKIEKRIAMFKELNPYRRELGRPEWEVISVTGEKLIEELKLRKPLETLLVIPAGESSNLEKVFSALETTFLQEEFFEQGGRGYFTCGAAYWTSTKRVYKDLSLEASEQANPVVKTTKLPLFKGTAEGPLCPFPGKKYRVGFYSDAVLVSAGEAKCTIYLSGGGSFTPDEGVKARVLVRYPSSELRRLGKPEGEDKKWENAVLIAKIGQGAGLFSMFHPYYGPYDIDVELYRTAFPDCGTDWASVQKKLSSFDERMHFVLKNMLIPLEDMDFKC